jgi:hypothetical protein
MWQHYQLSYRLAIIDLGVLISPQAPVGARQMYQLGSVTFVRQSHSVLEDAGKDEGLASLQCDAGNCRLPIGMTELQLNIEAVYPAWGSIAHHIVKPILV